MSLNIESPSSNSPPTSPHLNLQHFTSSTNLTPNSRIASPNRNSQLISRSPTSIPSSPTSVHSGSSAIFERDIEPIVASPPHHHHPADPHRTARGHNSETLEHSVPSVLDSAAEILTSTSSSPSRNLAGEEEEITVISPNPAYPVSSSSTSPMSTSRSPSPGGGFKSTRVPMLLNLPNILPGTSQLGVVSLPPLVSPSMATAVPNIEPLSIPGKSVSTPTSAYYSLTSSASSSPTTTTMETHPLRANMLSPEKVPSPNPSPRLRSSASGSPNMSASSKRLSFLSYTDLLTSTPSSTLPLSSFTTAISTNQPEPPSRSLFVEPDLDVEPEKSFDSAQISLRGRSSVLDGSGIGRSGSMSLVTGEGGEWQREGLGRGLEEQLEMIAAAVSSASSPVGIPVAAGGPGV